MPAPLADANPDVRVLSPVHINPVVSDEVHAILGGYPRIELAEPLDDLAVVVGMIFLTEMNFFQAKIS